METNYWLMLNDWKGRHDAMHPVTDPDTNETCYTWSGINCPIRQITVRSLGGFNLTYYSKPSSITMKSYWVRVQIWMTKYRALYPNNHHGQTAYTFQGINRPGRQIIVRDLGGFNLMHHAKPLR